jgi:hypothetical protein
MDELARKYVETHDPEVREEIYRLVPQLTEMELTSSGLRHAISQAIADAGINMDFVVAQVIGRKYSAVFGFESEVDASKGAAVIRKAAAAKKR